MLFTYISKHCRYEKELKVEYKVQCGEDDELAYYEFTHLDLQPKDCEDDGNLRWVFLYACSAL